MALDPERGPWIIAAMVIGTPALIGGWFLVRKRVDAAAAEVSCQGGDIPLASAPDPDDRPSAPANPAVG
jgi:L-asparagine permease